MELPPTLSYVLVAMLIVFGGLGLYWFCVDAFFARKQQIAMSSKHLIHVLLGIWSLFILFLVSINITIYWTQAVFVLLLTGVGFIGSGIWDHRHVSLMIRRLELRHQVRILQRIELVYPMFEIQWGLLSFSSGCILALKYLFGINNTNLLLIAFLFLVASLSIGLGLFTGKWRSEALLSIRPINREG